MKLLIITGGALLIVSMYPVWRFFEILLDQRAANARYEFADVHENEATLAGHTVQLKDKIAPDHHYKERDRKIGPIKILIDGRDYSIGSDVIIRPKFRDANRYFEWVHIVRLKEKNTGELLLAIVQRSGELHKDRFGDRSKVKFRILYVTEVGEVSEEAFTYLERDSSPYRGPLVNRVSPEVEMYLPTLLVPFLVPGSSGLIGIVLLVLGIKGSIRRRHERDERSRRK